MKTKEDVEKLEKLVGQLQGLYAEITLLAKKAPNDAVNEFKLALINKVLTAGNQVLGPSYRPFQEFVEFDSDGVPTNSDVTMILAQYMEEAERYRSDNVAKDGAWWVYVIDGEKSEIRSGPPSKIGRKT